MERQEIIQSTAAFVAGEFASEGSGHDWFHIDRVRRIALRIGKTEGGDLFIIEMAALLHDLDDYKITGLESPVPEKAKSWLSSQNVEADVASLILQVIEEVSYKGSGIETPVSSVESAVVQDADRLDAIGAIGIARTFAYGGHKNRLIHDPKIAPEMHDDFQSYKNSTAPTINHFYEKLLLLKDRMNTNTAKLMAAQRHQFMENYLQHFFDEWEAQV
ncbi:MAG: HD domain-containing protein [Bacteroidota bacterium]|nr:HD domain-containing protein [Bacteroidota bacterium]